MKNSCDFALAPSLPGGKGVRVPSPPAGAGARHFFPRGKAPPRIDALGRIEGYASVFGAMDLARDVVMPGAFRDSLARRSPGGVKLLWQHDPATPLGSWTRIEEDRHGLFVAGELDMALSKARELASLIARGAVDGLSIGYRTEIDRQEPATGIRRLDKIDLWEISLVTFPLLPQARIHALKGWGNGNGGTGASASARAFHRRLAAYV